MGYFAVFELSKFGKFAGYWSFSR